MKKEKQKKRRDTEGTSLKTMQPKTSWTQKSSNNFIVAANFHFSAGHKISGISRIFPKFPLQNFEFRKKNCRQNLSSRQCPNSGPTLCETLYTDSSAENAKLRPLDGVPNRLYRRCIRNYFWIRSSIFKQRREAPPREKGAKRPGRHIKNGPREPKKSNQIFLIFGPKSSGPQT